MRVTAKKHERETGLAGIGASPRGYYIKVNGKEIATIYAGGNKQWEHDWNCWKVQFFGDKFTGLKRFISAKTWPLTDEGLQDARQEILTFVKRKIAGNK